MDLVGFIKLGRWTAPTKFWELYYNDHTFTTVAQYGAHGDPGKRSTRTFLSADQAIKFIDKTITSKEQYYIRETDPNE
jgi:predicted DNA-binding WGR domain protein